MPTDCSIFPITQRFLRLPYCHVRLPAALLFVIVVSIVLSVSISSCNAQFDRTCVPEHPSVSAEQCLQISQGKHLDLIDGDQVWWISGRNVSGQLDGLDELVTMRYSTNEFGVRAWTTEPTNDFVNAYNDEDSLTTVFYVHGNRTDVEWSLNRGIQVYDRIFNSCEQRKPVRFVIWHWPAEQFVLPIQEYEDNSRRAIIHGRHFAKFTQWLDPNQPLRMIGYSLGSQFILSAAEQVAHFAERSCGNSQAWLASHVRVVTLAPVAACSWPHNETEVKRIGAMLDEILVLENNRDIALRAFKLKCKFENPSCLCGKNVFDPFKKHGTTATHIEVGHLVGREHSIAKYVEPERVRRLIKDHLHLR